MVYFLSNYKSYHFIANSPIFERHFQRSLWCKSFKSFRHCLPFCRTPVCACISGPRQRPRCQISQRASELRKLSLNNMKIEIFNLNLNTMIKYTVQSFKIDRISGLIFWVSNSVSGLPYIWGRIFGIQPDIRQDRPDIL